MIETTIEECLKKDSYTRPIFRGVFAKNELPEDINYPSCFVINTKPRSHRGEHWLGFFYNKKGVAYFFDSYGLDPAFYGFENFLKETSTSWTFNKQRIQGFSSYCGYYTVLFLLFRARNKTKIFFSYFNKNFELNDRKVTMLINEFKK
jgi:hypothetical protein